MREHRRSKAVHKSRAQDPYSRIHLDCISHNRVHYDWHNCQSALQQTEALVLILSIWEHALIIQDQARTWNHPEMFFVLVGLIGPVVTRDQPVVAFRVNIPGAFGLTQFLTVEVLMALIAEDFTFPGSASGNAATNANENDNSNHRKILPPGSLRGPGSGWIKKCFDEPGSVEHVTTLP